MTGSYTRKLIIKIYKFTPLNHKLKETEYTVWIYMYVTWQELSIVWETAYFSSCGIKISHQSKFALKKSKVGRYIIVCITTNCTSAEIQVVINSTVEETMSHHKESNM
jgi:hypothetical protein